MTGLIPRQAAVVCGGLGKRLRPLTELIPKPMVEVAGRPFLEHLLRQFADEGIVRFVLMTGYLGEHIHEFFGDGSKWGWEIGYSHGPVDWETGRRIVEAAGLLDDSFFLLYSDNYASVDLGALAGQHAATGRPITATLKAKSEGNVQYSEATDITVYDPTRSSGSLDYVEIGYMVVERDAGLRLLAEVNGYPDVGLSDVLETAASVGQLGGFPTGGAYYSISDPIRLEVIREYFSAKKILLIDRDGTINRKAAPGDYVSTWEQFEFVPETVEAMRELSASGFEFIVITNQAGIALGVLDEAEVDRIHENMTKELGRAGISILGVYMSPDHWNTDSLMRKPAPGMFHLASDEHRFRLDQALYVGDDIRDCAAAANAGCGMVLLADTFEIDDLPVTRHHRSIYPSLQEAVEGIVRYYYEGADS